MSLMEGRSALPLVRPCSDWCVRVLTICGKSGEKKTGVFSVLHTLRGTSEQTLPGLAACVGFSAA